MILRRPVMRMLVVRGAETFLIFLAVLPVIGDVEAGSVEYQAGAGGHLSIGGFSTYRTWHHSRSGCH